MKKHFSKLVAIAIASVLLASTVLSAFAEPPGEPPEGGGGFGGGANMMTYDYSGTLAGSLSANGETVISGDSDITVTVTGSYSTSVTTSSANTLSTDFIDRTAFDGYYNLSTSFGTNAGGETVTEPETTEVTISSNKSPNSVSNNPGLYIACGAVALISLAVIAVILGKKNKSQD